MSLVGSRHRPHTLPERLRRPPPSSSGSEDTNSTSHDGSEPAIWPPHAPYPPSFDDEDDDDQSDTESVTSSTLTDRVPPLSRGSSISSSTHSATQTDLASAHQNGYVLSSDDGIAVIPHALRDPADITLDLLCPFHILDCTEVFSTVKEFKIHVFSHFRGHPLPTTALCFLCDEKFEQTSEDDPAMAWNKMLGHMAHEHFRRGQEVGVIRAGFALMRYMYDRKIISDYHFKRSQICPAPVALPAAAMRRSESDVSSLGSMAEREPPVDAPSPPSTRSPSSTASEPVAWPRRSSYTNESYVTFAGARAERRRRDSTRLLVQHTRTMLRG